MLRGQATIDYVCQFVSALRAEHNAAPVSQGQFHAFIAGDIVGPAYGAVFDFPDTVFNKRSVGSRVTECNVVIGNSLAE